MAKKMKWYEWTALTLLIVGGLTWGTIGLFGFNLVNFVFGSWAWLERTVYGLVGLSAGYSIWTFAKLKLK